MTEQEENTLNRLLEMVQDLDNSAANDGANNCHPSVKTETLYEQFAIALRHAITDRAQRQAGQEQPTLCLSTVKRVASQLGWTPPGQAGQEVAVWRDALEDAILALENSGWTRSRDASLTTLRQALAAPQPAAHLDKDAEIAALKAEKEAAYSYASGLAITLFQKHYSNDPDYASGRVVWGLCDSTTGVLTQIDNMVSGLAMAQAVQP